MKSWLEKVYVLILHSLLGVDLSINEFRTAYLPA